MTWVDFVKDCGLNNNRQTIIHSYELKYKNEVVEWEGKVLRVDGDHNDDDDESELQIS